MFNDIDKALPAVINSLNDVDSIIYKDLKSTMKIDKGNILDYTKLTCNLVDYYSSLSVLVSDIGALWKNLKVHDVLEDAFSPSSVVLNLCNLLYSSTKMYLNYSHALSMNDLFKLRHNILSMSKSLRHILDSSRK